MTNPISGPPPASSGRPQLTPAQAGRVVRACRALQDSRTSMDALGVSYHLGALEFRLGDMIELIDELTGAALNPPQEVLDKMAARGLTELTGELTADARMVRDVRQALAMLTWDLAGHTISPTSESPQYVLKAIQRIIGGAS